MIKSYTLNLDSQCNQRCLFCMKSDDINKKRKITYKMVAHEIIKAKEQGYELVDFFGGEPTTYSFLNKATKLVQDLDMQFGLATNAILFSSKKYTDSFFKNIDIEKIGCLRISMHGIGEIHNRLVQNDTAYDNLIQGMKNILFFTERFSVNIVITSLNYETLSEMVEILHKIGVKAVKFSGINNVGRSRENQWLLINEKKVEKHLIAAIKKSEQFDFKFIEVLNMPNFYLKNKHKFKRLSYDEIS